MLKKKNNKSIDNLPFVSVCTPTFNRRPFIETMFQCFRNQDYPKSKIEWIIVDDGTDKIKDLVDKSNIPQIKYVEVNEKMSLGKKRNYMHTLTTGSIIIYMDDDDYYPPERISHAVETLEKNKHALCAGASEIYVYFKHVKKMIQCGPYGPNHATAGTFAFRRELLDITRYDDNAALAEEKLFLKEYTIPFVQLEPLKTILVFSHVHNTFDKKKLFDNAHPDFFKESPKTVESFIRKPEEESIKKFFMSDIDLALKNYEPGEPKMKPDVLKQIKEIEKEHKKIMEAQMKAQQTQGQILLERPGEPPITLSTQDVVNIMKQQQQQIEQLTKRNEDINIIIQKMQEKILELRKENNEKDKMIETLKNKKVEENNSIKENDNECIRIEIKEDDSDDETEPASNNESYKPKSKSDPEIKIKIKNK